MIMAAYGYIRVSSAEQAGDDRTSLETQRRKVAAVAELCGLDLARIIEEPGVSGGTAMAERPGGREPLSLLQRGDTVIVSKLDRGFRNAADALAQTETWKRQGIDPIVADMGSEPVTQNGVSRMFFGMLALVAQFERERIAERTAEGRAAKRKAGGHIGGTAPFGYRKVGEGRTARLEPIGQELEAIETMRALAAEGHATRSIATVVAA
jgi:DNA invertase Pin-like site-specific DNA recombinase